MKYIYTIILSLFVVSSFAQNATIKGKIYDAQSNEPLPFVNIVVLGTETGTVSDLDGSFQIFGLKPGFIRLTTSFIGYKNTVSDEIEISNANTAFLEIKMEPSTTNIDEVKVVASPFRKTDESRSRCGVLVLEK